MLFATFGAVWTICILCIVFVAIYLYGSHQDSDEKSAYMWDTPRLWMLFALGVSTCYLGTARMASTLSTLLMRKLNQHPIPLLLPEQWLNLSAIFAVVALMIGLLNRNERVDPEFSAIGQDENSLLTDIRTLPRPVILPEDSTTYLESVELPAPVNALSEDHWPQTSAWQTLRGGLVPSFVATVGVMVLGIIGWLAFISAVEPSTSAAALRLGNPESEVSAVDAIVAQPADTTRTNLARSAFAASLPSAPSLDSSQAANVDQTLAPDSLVDATTVYTSAIPIALVAVADEPSGTESGNTESGSRGAIASPTATSAPTATPITISSPQPSIRVPNNYEVNARLSPDVNAAIVYVLPSGATAQIRELLPNGQWALVVLPDGRQAWVATWVVDVFNATS